MKQIIKCVVCTAEAELEYQKPMKLVAIKENGNEIEAGHLECPSCEKGYAIYG
jgi:uncharacterized protein YbaR (Trm112 family)